MKKLIVILAAGMIFSSCNTDEDKNSQNETAEITNAIEPTENYSIMSFEQQEANIMDRINELKTYSNQMTADDKATFDQEIENLETQLRDFQTKRATSENDTENSDFKTAAQEVADNIRTTSDALKAKAKQGQVSVQETKEEIKSDIQETKEDLKSDIKKTKEDIKSDIKVKKEDIKSDIKETKQELKQDIKDKAKDVKTDIKEGAQNVKEGIKDALTK